MTQAVRPNDIAVIGLAARVPGARDVAEFWRNLRDGREAITFFTDEELRQAGVEPARLADPRYVKANAVLPDADRFEAAFFGYTPREAELLDVQQRVFLQCAWTAFEHAGYDPLAMPGTVGVFAGAGLNTYLLRQIARNPAAVASAGGFQVLIANDKDFLATRVSYKLNLRGPSVAVQSACSTSLVAVHLAVQSLLAGECDAALAGGVSIRVPQTEGYTWQEGMILSRDGHCRPFDARAGGTIGGNGAGAVVLKRAEDALAAGDTIHALIRGSAINNDGAGKMGYTAPSLEGQEAVIVEALAVAGVKPEEIGYVEAHGTGTPLGDPIEVAALTRAFRRGTDRRQYCVLGSVKSNLGHLDAAAGVIGLIKAVLAIREGEIPPSLHFETPNPQIDFAASPFRVAGALTPWRPGADRRRFAGVSSFGIGGTNAHVVLEEPPAPQAAAAGDAPPELLVVSARTETALQTLREALAGQLEREGGTLVPTAYTLAAGRHAFAHRSWVVAATGADAARRLREAKWTAAGERPPSVAFLFPGQGSQFPGMMAGLYAGEPAFRAEVDRCAELLAPHVAFDLRRLVFGAGTEPQALARTDVAQPVLFVTSYALARLWMTWGARPEAMLGHSIGEWVAACLAGVFSLEDALRLVAARGRLMAAQPTGAMLAIGLGEPETRALVGGTLDVAAINASGQTVVSGPEPAIAALAATLEARGVAATRLQTSHAYHSAMMEPAARALEREFRGVTLRAPELRWISNVTGTWITAAEATSPPYWARHLRGTVRFRDGLQTLLEAAADQLLIEAGAGRTLGGLIARHESRQEGHVTLASARGARDQAVDAVILREALGRGWAAGLAVDWTAVFGRGRQRVPVPTYPFAGERYWIEAQPAGAMAVVADGAKRAEVGDWCYVPSWQPGSMRRGAPECTDGGWAIVADRGGLAEALAARLRAAGAQVRLCPTARAVTQAPTPRWIVSLRDVDHSADGDAGLEALCALGAELSGATLPAGARVLVVASGLQAFAGEQAVQPRRALLLGPARVLPNEVAGLHVKVVDVVPGSGSPDALAEALVGEAVAGDEKLVALRGRDRWVAAAVPAKLAAPAVSPWRDHGVYVITGGNGGIGLAVADALAARHQARLVLIARKAPDEAAQSRIAAMTAAGAQVLALQADVTDEIQLRRAHAEIRKQFGSVHGVIHAAGNAGGGALARPLSDAERASVLAPKVTGTELIERVFGGEPLDVFVLMSSLTAELGEFGQARYAAANAFLDAFATERRRAGRPVVSIAWDAWRDVGMAARGAGERTLAAWQEQQAARRITTEEGLAVLDRVVASGHARVIVSTVDLAVRQRELADARRDGAVATALSTTRTVAPSAAARAQHRRPDLAVPLAPPTSEAQRRIAAVWEELLGLAPVGVNDNFFDLGGHSLLASQAVARLREAGVNGLTLAALFESPTVAGLAAKAGGDAPDEPELVPQPRSGALPLSFAQEALWLVDQVDGASAHYNEFGAQRIRGPLDVPVLERALNLIVQRHEVLRTSFEHTSDGAVQRIHPERPIVLACADATERELAARGIELSAAPFALDRDPLLRARLFRLGAGEHVLMIAVHHIVFDGWSSAVFFREALAAYAALLSGAVPALPALAVQYADFAIWQRRRLAGGRSEACGKFWREQLQAPLPVLNLPTDTPRPARQTFRGARLSVTIDGALTRQLEQRARAQDASLFMALAAAYAALLGRVAGQDDIIVGVPMAGRDRKELEPLIGLCINVLPIRLSLADNPTLAELVSRVRATVVAAYAHAGLPFEQIVEAARPPRDASRSVVCQAMMTFQNATPPVPAPPGLAIASWEPAETPARSDLDWYGWETADGVSGYFVYNRDLFAAGTVERWRGRLLRLCAAIATEPSRRLADVTFDGPALPALRRARPAGAGSTTTLS